MLQINSLIWQTDKREGWNKSDENQYEWMIKRQNVQKGLWGGPNYAFHAQSDIILFGRIEIKEAIVFKFRRRKRSGLSPRDRGANFVTAENLFACWE